MYDWGIRFKGLSFTDNNLTDCLTYVDKERRVYWLSRHES